jgi:hypothetical protein
MSLLETVILHAVIVLDESGATETDRRRFWRDLADYALECANEGG